MSLHLLHWLDRILGTLLFFTVVPVCRLLTHLMPRRGGGTPRNITVLKLRGGGSLLMAMPALLGLRKRYPYATFTLVGAAETEKFADLTGIFTRTILINSGSLRDLIVDSAKALLACFRHDVFIDLEAHSTLAAVFTPLTFAIHRIGFVKAGEPWRAASYTDAIYFNVQAPVYTFYEQAAARLGGVPATVEECREMLLGRLDSSRPLLKAEHPKPVAYLSVFTSSLAPERMMPATLWAAQLQKRFGQGRAFTMIISHASATDEQADIFINCIKVALPAATILRAENNRSLRQAMDDINRADEFWGIDSGLLHIARLLGKPSTSFWGPSNPAYRLRPIDGLQETVYYRSFPCSPCVHMGTTSPCHGDNQCMKKLFSDDAPTAVIVR